LVRESHWDIEMRYLDRLGHFLFLAPLLSLTGCVEMVLDRARLDADLPMPPPAFVQDSTRQGDLNFQGGVRISDGTFIQSQTYRWSSLPVGGYAQVQYSVLPSVRWVAGAGRSSKSLVWTGVVARRRNFGFQNEIEVDFGGSDGSAHLEGHLKDSEADYNEFTDTGLVLSDQRGWRTWFQASFRTRCASSGPWFEFRLLPSFDWGTITKNPGAPLEYSLLVETASLGFGAGWIQDFSNGSSLLVGARLVTMGKAPDAQFLASCQWRLSKLSLD
jgi:hypothetical protein